MKKHFLHEFWTEPWNSLGIIKHQSLLPILEATHACTGIYQQYVWYIELFVNFGETGKTFHEMAITYIVQNPSHNFLGETGRGD